jgi:hypothetical protein
MPVVDSSTVFRVVLQNPNGLSLTYDAISLRDELTTCSQYGPAIVHLPKTNVNWKRPDQFMAFKSAVHRTWMNSVITVSRSPEDFLSNYQPGGTATIVCNNWISRVTNKGEDHMGLGRWSYVTLRGIGSKKVTIIPLIMPCIIQEIPQITNNSNAPCLTFIPITTSTSTHNPENNLYWTYKLGLAIS